MKSWKNYDVAEVDRIQTAERSKNSKMQLHDRLNISNDWLSSRTRNVKKR